MTVPNRSDVALGSAERLASSGQTEAELVRRTRSLGKKLAAESVLVVNLRDPDLTISQQDRAAMLMREIYGEAH